MIGLVLVYSAPVWIPAVLFGVEALLRKDGGTL